jgi:SseB protein N-terminal domain
MSDTPLSDLISALGSHPNRSAVAEFHDSFMTSRLGVIASGLPADRVPGETFQVGPGDRIALQTVQIPDGRRMIKACADPRIFVERYPGTNITAEMLGRDLLGMVLQSSEFDGVLVCSAASFRSAPIGRDEATRLLGAAGSPRPKARPWWKIWGL